MKSLALLFAVFAYLILPVQAQTQPATNPREQLTLMVNRLSKWPRDYVLRERIMKLAREVRPLPPVPEAAYAAARRGEALYAQANKAAKPKPGDFQPAVDAYREVTTLAPWWADAYLNLGALEEKADYLAAADRSFGIYLLSNPGPDGAQKARDSIARIQALEELMGKQVAAGSITPEDLLSALDGAAYDCGSDGRYYLRVGIRNGTLFDDMVLIHPPVELPPQPNPSGLQPAGLAPPPASDRRQGLNFMKPYGRMHTVSPSQVDRQGQTPCRRIRGAG